MSNIYIVGFMGTGKTAAGREAARRKKWRFLDLDELIELREKSVIADIFAKSGEPYFRRIEKKVLKVSDKDNINIMKETGIIVCLRAAPEVILKRTSDYTHRPLLNVREPKKQIEMLLKLRAPYYAQADACVDTSNLSVGQVAQNIIRVITRKTQRTSEKKGLKKRIKRKVSRSMPINLKGR
jgi:shikimate kinase